MTFDAGYPASSAATAASLIRAVPQSLDSQCGSDATSPSVTLFRSGASLVLVLFSRLALAADEHLQIREVADDDDDGVGNSACVRSHSWFLGGSPSPKARTTTLPCQARAPQKRLGRPVSLCSSVGSGWLGSGRVSEPISGSFVSYAPFLAVLGCPRLCLCVGHRWG